MTDELKAWSEERAYERAKAEYMDKLDKIRAEIKAWYWKADKQALAKDPCVVDAMIDLFIRTIDKYKYKIESEVSDVHTD